MNIIPSLVIIFAGPFICILIISFIDFRQKKHWKKRAEIGMRHWEILKESREREMEIYKEFREYGIKLPSIEEIEAEMEKNQ